MQDADAIHAEQEKQSQEQTGPDPAVKEFGNGLLGEETDDDQDHTRGDDYAQGGTAGNGPGAEDGIVAAFFHLRESNRGHGRGGGGIGAADRGKGGAGQDGGHGDPSADMAHPLIGGGVEFFIDPGIKGNLSHKDEQGDGGHPVFGKSGPDVGADHAQTGLEGNDQAETAETDDAHGEAHGHPQQEHGGQQDNDSQNSDEGRFH